MRSFTVLTIALVFMAILCMAKAADQCMCSCCRGAHCKPVDIDPMFDLPNACTMDACKAACPSKFPDQCGQPDSSVDGMCMGPMGSASMNFNQYMVFALFFLGFIINAVFHF